MAFCLFLLNILLSTQMFFFFFGEILSHWTLRTFLLRRVCTESKVCFFKGVKRCEETNTQNCHHFHHGHLSWFTNAETPTKEWCEFASPLDVNVLFGPCDWSLTVKWTSARVTQGGHVLCFQCKHAIRCDLVGTVLLCLLLLEKYFVLLP